MNISRTEFYKAKNWHYRMWDWLSKNGGKTKEQFLNSEYTDEELPIENKCFACMIAEKLCEGDEIICEHCPITDKYNDKCLNGLWELYEDETSHHREVLAILIRDLKWDKNNVLDRIED